MTKYITKASGEREEFNVQKFQRSLRKAGANQDIIDRLTQEILHDDSFTSTKDIYAHAFKALRKDSPPIAARYNLKIALSELGPSGYPFERFIAELFKHQGFTTQLNQIVPGLCVSHELDVVLTKDNQHIMVECKFHEPHLKANVKVPLYIKARFEDIEAKIKQENKDTHRFHQAWIITNTKFTTDATAYGECAGITLMSWSYPERKSLARMIDTLGLHPVTALTSLSRKQKHALIEQGLVLCKDMFAKKHVLQQLGLGVRKMNAVLQEAEAMCKLGAID